MTHSGEARRYHERTKHSSVSVRSSAHYLDWDNRPDPFKRYREAEPVGLPADLTRVLRWGAGVIRTREFPNGETYYFRTYPSAGALYPVEVYVACAELPGLVAGLYHFHPGELALRPLRLGDQRERLAAVADAPELARSAAVLVLSGILWRSAWKYQARAYRHLYWDAGAMLANLLALAASARLEPRLLTAFLDAELNELLGIDGEREAALALLTVGRAEGAASVGDGEPLRLEPAPLSPREQLYPEAVALQAASSFASVEEIRRYRSANRRCANREGEAAHTDAEGSTLSQEPLETVIRRRGSARDFLLEPVPAAELAALLAHAATPIPADFPPLTETYVVAHALEGLEPGAYRFDPPEAFELLRRGEFRAQTGYLCLEQVLGAKAAATLFFLADLDEVLAMLGDRGYRAAQLEAGIRAGRMYLGAYAQGLGATGLTFYDDEVTEFLAPGTAKTPMMCVAVGIDARRPKLRAARPAAPLDRRRRSPF
jgi:SagB-type dehydrogenase family enzyme